MTPSPPGEGWGKAIKKQFLELPISYAWLLSAQRKQGAMRPFAKKEHHPHTLSNSSISDLRWAYCTR